MLRSRREQFSWKMGARESGSPCAMTLCARYSVLVLASYSAVSQRNLSCTSDTGSNLRRPNRYNSCTEVQDFLNFVRVLFRTIAINGEVVSDVREDESGHQCSVVITPSGKR